MSERFLLILLVSLPLAVFSQEKYLSYDEIEFKTEAEKRIFESLLKNEGEFIDGFLAIAPEDSLSFDKWKSSYSREIDELKQRKKSKKIEKDVKLIYDRLHEVFLRKYESMAFFDQIFENGVYNCVTAVALYAMSFEKLDIPYCIKETPSHVYIIAYPGTSQLLIETTDPINGFESFTPEFREDFVSQLTIQKLVDENDIASKGVYSLFDEFYFGGASDLTLKQLVATQYYNLGVSYFNQKNYHKAWNAFSKAQLLYSSEQLNSSLFASLENCVLGSDYSDWNDIKLLPYLERFRDFDIRNTNIVAEFQRMLNYVLVSNNDAEKAEKAFDLYINKSQDKEIVTEVSYLYFYERSRIAFNRANYEEALDFIVVAYKAKPGNSNAENLLIESYKMSYRNKPTDEALERLDTLMANNPDLVENNHLNTLRLNLFLTSMGEKFESKNPEEGTNFMKLFESQISNKPNYIFNQNVLGIAYSKAAVYYFKKGYSNKARSIIRAGLNYAPNNYELKTRLRMIND